MRPITNILCNLSVSFSKKVTKLCFEGSHQSQKLVTYPDKANFGRLFASVIRSDITGVPALARPLQISNCGNHHQ